MFASCLLPVYKLGYLIRDTDWVQFVAASRYASTFLALYDEHASIDFRPLQGFNADWNAGTSIDTDRVRMATATLLHFDGDIADVVRWIGGPHVRAHRDITATLGYLQGKIEPDLCLTLERMWRHGSPAVCNASATEKNFQAYRG